MEGRAETLLSVRSLGKVFRTSGAEHEALSGVSLDIMRGEIFGLVGESGSGKSTLGRTVMGIYEPSAGEVYFLGRRIRAGTEEHEGRIKELKARGRVEFFRLLRRFLSSPKKAKEHIENYKNVNKDLNIEIKNAKEKLTRARVHLPLQVEPKIQMIFQDPSASLNPRMTVGESVAEGLIAIGISDREERERRVDEALRAVGMSPRDKGRYPHEFSGGQRQRIGIARAVVMSPELLIADEPVSALDVSVQAQVINLLEDLAAEMSLSVLFIAHDLSVVRHISDRIGVMYKGRLVELAPSEELFSNPLHPYTRSLLSAMPTADPILERGRMRDVYVEEPTSGERIFYDLGGGHFVLGTERELEKYKSGGKNDDKQ